MPNQPPGYLSCTGLLVTAGGLVGISALAARWAGFLPALGVAFTAWVGYQFAWLGWSLWRRRAPGRGRGERTLAPSRLTP